MILVQGDSIVGSCYFVLLGIREVGCYAFEMSTQPGVLLATDCRILVSFEKLN